MEPDEVIKWEARPSLFLILSGEMTIRDVVLNIVVALFDIQIALAVIFIPVLLVGAIFYFLPVWGKIIGLLIMILIMTMKFKRIRNTRYAYSNKRIFISVWNWGKHNLQIINLDAIGKVSTELYRNGGGIIHFLPLTPFPFKGKALLSGFNRHYPTIEYVKNQGCLPKLPLDSKVKKISFRRSPRREHSQSYVTDEE